MTQVIFALDYSTLYPLIQSLIATYYLIYLGTVFICLKKFFFFLSEKCHRKEQNIIWRKEQYQESEVIISGITKSKFVLISFSLAGLFIRDFYKMECIRWPCWELVNTFQQILLCKLYLRSVCLNTVIYISNTRNLILNIQYISWQLTIE